MPFLFEIVSNKRNGLDVDKYVPFSLCSSVVDMPAQVRLYPEGLPCCGRQGQYLHLEVRRAYTLDARSRRI